MFNNAGELSSRWQEYQKDFDSIGNQSVEYFSFVILYYFSSCKVSAFSVSSDTEV